jgi:phage tail sheath protein FI
MLEEKAAKVGGIKAMSALANGVEAYRPGQKVQTSFGPGVISAISHIDSILYVTLSKDTASLYIFRPEQVEAVDYGDYSRTN